MHTFPTIQQIDDYRYELKSTFFYYSKRLRTCIKIDPGFVYDGASVPRIFWRIFTPFTGRYTAAACLHDALYGAELFSREKCDLVFLDAMRDYNTGFLTRWTLFLAVRAFGWIVWDLHSEQSIAEGKRFVKVFR